MNREGAETYLRLLAEVVLRRSLEAAREQPGPVDPGGHRGRLLPVGQALAAVGAMDLVTIEEILLDFNLAMNLRQLAVLADQDAGQEPGQPGRAARAARLLAQNQSIGQLAVPWAVRMRLGQSPGGSGTAGPGTAGPGTAGPGTADAPAGQVVPVGLSLPFRDGGVSGALYLMAFVHTGAGARFFAVWNLRGPALQDASLIRVGLFTVADDRGARYTLEFTPSGDSGWTSELGLRPAPPPGTRWLDVTAPGSKPVRIALDLACRAAPEPPAGEAELSEEKYSPGEVLLVMLAERLLTAVPDYPYSQWRRPRVTPPGLRNSAGRLGDIVAALEAADVLSPLSPVPGRLATLCASLDIPGHGITARPARQLPEPWLSVLAHYQRRKPDPVPLLEGYAAMTADLPELDGIRLTLLGLHHTDGGSALHVLVRGRRPGTHLGPFSIDLTLPLSIWLRDSGGRWHCARVAEQHQTEPRDGELTMRLQLVPPLTRATPSAEILARGQSAEVRTTVPLRWGFPP